MAGKMTRGGLVVGLVLKDKTSEITGWVISWEDIMRARQEPLQKMRIAKVYVGDAQYTLDAYR